LPGSKAFPQRERADRGERAADRVVYEDVRADETQFLLVPGHEDERIEQVVREWRQYNIVRKVQRIVTAYVRRLNPRAR
jgi:hypothetical protein